MVMMSKSDEPPQKNLGPRVVAIGLVVTALLVPLAFPPKPPHRLDAEDLVYFRDDNNQICYTYFKNEPQSLTVVPCDSVRWP
jgi:hypothetical protein